MMKNSSSNSKRKNCYHKRNSSVTSKDTAKKGNGRATSTEALSIRAKNKSLVLALDKARQEIRKLTEDNLLLKIERQNLLEKINSLETQLEQMHTTQQTLVGTINRVNHELSSAVHFSNIEQKHSAQQVIPDVQLSSTPLKCYKCKESQSSPMDTDDASSIEQKAVNVDHQSLSVTPIMEIGSIGSVPHISMNVTMDTKEFQQRRPKRSCSSMNSYQEPKLNSKLRRGDPNTDSSSNCWTPYRDKKIKSRKLHARGLTDITNLKL